MGVEFVLLALVAVALFFDFTNGFHDTANAIATSVSTRAVSPRLAVLGAAILNFLGAFASFAVAATVAKGIVEADFITPDIVLAGLVGAIAWDLITWYLGLPTSSSHALIGGVSGSAVAAAGLDVMKWDGLVGKVLIPSLLAPALGVVGAAGVMLVILWSIRKVSPGIVNAAAAMGLGTYAGGWRIIRTLGQRVAKLEPPQGFAAETATASILWVTGHVGFPVSTTHTISGSVLGAGATRRFSAVRWGVAGNILVAWMLTIPASAAIGAAMELL